jgi:hypothetical protein
MYFSFRRIRLMVDGVQPRLVPSATGNSLGIELSDDRRDGLARREVATNASNDVGLRAEDHHPIAVRTWSPASVDLHLADWLGPIAVRRLANAEAACLLSELAAEGLVAEIVEVELVHDPAHLEA